MAAPRDVEPTELVRCPDGHRAAAGRDPTIHVIPVIGDSMAPLLMPGEQVLVLTPDRTPSPPGLFLLWDGLSYVIKQVELLIDSSPPTLRIRSANPAYGSYDTALGETCIVGRVVGRWSRI